MLTMCDIVWSSFAHIKELLSFPIWLLSLIVAVFIAGPAVDPALCTDQVSCDHQLDHKKQDHQHHPHHLQVLGNHHCTLVHPCKTEHLENYAGFPFLIRMSQFERKKKTVLNLPLISLVSKKCNNGWAAVSCFIVNSENLWHRIEMSTSNSWHDGVFVVIVKDLLHRNVPCYVELLEHHWAKPSGNCLH